MATCIPTESARDRVCPDRDCMQYNLSQPRFLQTVDRDRMRDAGP
jgi:hypothetical protein